MKKLLFPMLLLCSVAAWCQQPGSKDYPITVHVVSSRMVSVWQGEKLPTVEEEDLTVVINGKKYVLEGKAPKTSFISFGVIAPGDYDAKLTQDRNKGNYLRYQQYEILFPDNTKKTFNLIGESE